MGKCKDCDMKCEGMCFRDWRPIEKIDTKGAFLFWPSVIVAAIAIAAWWLS